MALTFRGFDGTSLQLDETHFARLMRSVGKVHGEHGVVSGLVGTSTGTRSVSFSAGEGHLPGITFSNAGGETLAFDANATTTARTDYAILRADWSTNTLAFAVLKGASATAPALTQTPGVLWEMPLLRVSVRPSVATFLSTDLQVCKPLPRDVRFFNGSNMALTNLGQNNPGVVLSSVTITDPGWPYVLELEGHQRISGDSGYGLTQLRVDSTTYGSHYSGVLTTTSGQQPLHSFGRTGILSGQRVADLFFAPSGATSQMTAQGGTSNYFTVRQIPA